MHYVQTYPTPDGGSGMETIEVSTSITDFVPGTPAFGVSEAQTAASTKYLQVGPGWQGDWHPTPVRQYLLVLKGGFRIFTTDGQSAEFHPGDAVLLGDTTGKGHHTVMLGEEDTWIMAIALT